MSFSYLFLFLYLISFIRSRSEAENRPYSRIYEFIVVRGWRYLSGFRSSSLTLIEIEGTHQGTLQVIMDIRAPIEGKHVLIVEDIVDSGACEVLEVELALISCSGRCDSFENQVDAFGAETSFLAHLHTVEKARVHKSERLGC